MSSAEIERTYTEAEFQQAIKNWKKGMTPQLCKIARETAADMLDGLAAIIKNADVNAEALEAKVAVDEALSQAAGLARDLAMNLRSREEFDAKERLLAAVDQAYKSHLHRAKEKQAVD